MVSGLNSYEGRWNKIEIVVRMNQPRLPIEEQLKVHSRSLSSKPRLAEQTSFDDLESCLILKDIVFCMIVFERGVD